MLAQFSTWVSQTISVSLEIENIEKRTLQIIHPNLNYIEALRQKSRNAIIEEKNYV